MWVCGLVDLMYMMVGVFDLMISFGCLFALCLVVWVLGSLFGCLRVWFGAVGCVWPFKLWGLVVG